MHNITARSILSPENGMNLYRGCTHGCIYCDSRSNCYQMDHAFEDVAVKENAPQLLERALRAKRKRCMIATGAMCDPYLPLEAELRLSRTCLELIDWHGFGATVLTKSDLVLRDLDVLQRIHHASKCVVQMTLTTADEDLCRQVEPHVCTTARRVEVLEDVRAAGIPTVVWLSPILPFLNDTEENIREIVERCAAAGVWGILCFGMGVTLREGDREYFYDQLDRRFPGLKARYVREFGNQYVCNSPRHDALMALFRGLCRRYGIEYHSGRIFEYLKTFEDKMSGEQLGLF